MAPEALRQGIRSIWCDVLRVSEATDTSDFFELGGESMTAIHLAARVENDLDVVCTIEDIFENPTLGELSEFVVQRTYA